MTTGYKEITKQWAFEYGAEPDTAQRMFIDDATGNDAFPPLYDPFPDPRTSITLQRVKESPLGESPTEKQYVLIYKDDDGGEEGGSRSFTEQSTTKSIRLGGELIPIGDTAYTWDDDSSIGDGVQVFKRTNTGTLTLESETENFNQYVSEVVKRMGSINKDTFCGFEKGLLLFSGVDMSESQRPSSFGNNVDRYWKVQVYFELKIQRGLEYGGDVTELGWQYFFDPNVGAYRKLKPLLYEETTEFKQLVAQP